MFVHCRAISNVIKFHHALHPTTCNFSTLAGVLFQGCSRNLCHIDCVSTFVSRNVIQSTSGADKYPDWVINFEHVLTTQQHTTVSIRISVATIRLTVQLAAQFHLRRLTTFDSCVYVCSMRCSIVRIVCAMSRHPDTMTTQHNRTCIRCAKSDCRPSAVLLLLRPPPIAGL